jgi:type III pantothenate kinase
MKLLIDLGNTRLKWATCNQPENIHTGQPVDNNRISASSLIGLWQEIAKPDRVAIAGVGSKNLHELIVQTVDTLWPGISVHTACSKKNALGLTNAYQQPERLGVDRWLAMVSAYHKYQKPLCIAGCGTAITIDIVNSYGKHQGGLISPGLRLMQNALAAGTENLNQIGDKYPDGLATNTDAAIYNGTVFAICGLIEHVLALQTSPVDLILTGGNAEIIADKLLIPAKIEPDIVLHGLALTSPEC